MLQGRRAYLVQTTVGSVHLQPIALSVIWAILKTVQVVHLFHAQLLIHFVYLVQTDFVYLANQASTYLTEFVHRVVLYCVWSLQVHTIQIASPAVTVVRAILSFRLRMAIK